MADLESQHRRELIRELIVEELRATGALDDGDLVTYWMTLVSTHGTDGVDEVGPVFHVLSYPEPTASQVLGLMEWKRMYMQAQVAKAVADGDS